MNNKPKSAVRDVFTVKHKRFLTPHSIRVTLTATDAQLAQWSGITIGGHKKLFIPPFGAQHIDCPDRDNPVATPQTLAVRTYTTRQIDVEQKEIWVDFVAHGENGPASAWALWANSGDILGLATTLSARPLVPDANAYLLIRDATALPVIGAILEELPASVKAEVILEVHGPEDELVLQTLADARIQWVHNPHPERDSQLANVVRSAPHHGTEKNKFVFITAEYRTVRELRYYFRDQHGWAPGDLYATSYWKAGESEQQSIAERRTEMRDK